MKKILLIGKTGQIGKELLQLLPEKEFVAVDRLECDLEQADSIIDCIRLFQPTIIINAAAYTAVDRAEEESEKARLVNGIAPGIIAEEALRHKSLLVHFSTDYVFDGQSTTPYTEGASPHPLNVYGQTKWEGEQAIMSSGCAFLVLRTSWVYGNHGRNFYQTMLRLAREKEELRIVNDQTGTPNHSNTLATTTVALINRYEPGKEGLYHLSSQGETTWFDFAQAIFDDHPPTHPIRLIPIPTSDYPLPAKRPCYSVLSTGKLKEVFGIELPDWRLDLAKKGFR